jgi:TonB-linked SusC/RagA family outer membrane protein
MKIKATTMSVLLVLLLFGMADQSMAQSRTVSGTVTSADDGQPLPGVTVLVKGTNRGTTTNLDGNYTLNVPADNNLLVFSYVGFVTQEVPINNRSTINVEMQVDVQQLSDVVVVGYGSQIKQDVTGNIAQVSGEDIASVPVNSFESAIQGRAAGVFINAGNGKLGQEMKVRIRGTSSISASAQPLYVIDGIPVTSSSLSSADDNETNPLASLDMNNIESITILKDASAAAIYGSRASNGVVLITTKKGQAGKTQVNVSYQTSVSEPSNIKRFLNSDEYIELLMEAAQNSSELDPSFDYVAYLESVFDFYDQGNDWRNNPVDFNWDEQAFQDASAHRFDISASGGDEKTRFYVAGGFSDEKGILIDNSFSKVNGRINLDHTANEALTLGLNLSLNWTVNDRLGNDNLFETPLQSVAQIPFSPIFADDPTQSGYQATEEYNRNTLYYNGVDITANSMFKTKVNRTFGNAFAAYSFNPNLVFRSEFGVDVLNQNEQYHYNNGLSYYVGAEGSGYSAFTEVLNYTTNNYLSYKNIFAEVHQVEVVGGMSVNIYQQDFTSVGGENFPNENFTQLQNAADITSGSSSETQYSFLSYFSRANYKFQDKYLLTLSARVDGSSRFGANNRYGFFPAASAGWILSEESFLADSDALSFLKLRASYGLTGNASVGNFPALGLYGGVAYAGTSALQPTQTPNPNLKWETTAQVDVGIDFGLFNDRITGELDYYVKNTNDLLLNVNVPGSTGFISQTRNVGKLENKGIEFVINTINSIGDFFWSTSFNIAANRNKVTDLGGQVIEGGTINRAIEGRPIGVFYAYEYAGVDPDNGDALYWINSVGADGFGAIDHSTGTTNNPNEANQVVIGNPNPDFIGGFNNKFPYKGVDLNILFQFVYGNDIFNGGGRFQSANGDYFDNQTRDQLNRWQQPGDVTDVPQARLFFGNGTEDSSRYLSDGSYLRLKSLSLGYNLPISVTEKLKMRNVRIFAIGSNLLTFTNYDGWDPEVTADHYDGNLALGNDFYAAPQPRTIAVGIDLGF